MKKIYFIAVTTIVLLSSCQKSISDFDPSTTQGGGTTIPPSSASGSFEATVNGQKIAFNLYAATLLRSTATNQKRLDISAISADNTKRIILTLGEETAAGNTFTVKKYTLNPFPDDDPATPTIDESLSTQGFTTYSSGPGSNNWITSVYDELGSFTITSCDSNTKLVSGTFETTLNDLMDPTIVIKITAGKVTNVKYTLLN
jgi:hypothetical protein